MDNTLYVFGHKNPDTDSIASAIVGANLAKALGYNAIAYKLGNINKETQYVLKTFEIAEPQTLESVSENNDIFLVDNNEFSQSVNGIEKANIKIVIDHHRINFKNEEPIFYISEPVGCTATILYQLYKQNNIEISEETAGLMLSAIISDTLLFKSPTCTSEDKKIAETLSSIAGVDLYEYGKNMLKAGTDISEFTPFEVINIDTKEFNDKNAKFEISQVNVVDLDSIFNRQAELEKVINQVIDTKNLDFYIFTATDILNANSKILVLGTKIDTVEKAFNIKLDNHTALLEGVVSRKKQMLPNILNSLD